MTPGAASVSLFTNVESAILNYEMVNAVDQIRNIDIAEPSTRLLAFLHLCQLLEYYCLFENLYVDHERRSSSVLQDVKEIFLHPSLGVDAPELRIVQSIEELEVEDYEPFLDGRLGTGFTEAMISRFLDSLAPPGVGKIKETMNAIFTYDRGLAIALSAERYRDILRHGCLATKFSRSSRDEDCSPPPSQIRTCGFPASGSSRGLPRGERRDHMLMRE